MVTLWPLCICGLKPEYEFATGGRCVHITRLSSRTVNTIFVLSVLIWGGVLTVGVFPSTWRRWEAPYYLRKLWRYVSHIMLTNVYRRAGLLSVHPTDGMAESQRFNASKLRERYSFEKIPWWRLAHCTRFIQYIEVVDCNGRQFEIVVYAIAIKGTTTSRSEQGW